MTKLEQVLRQLEDFILDEHDLYGVSAPRFDHRGKSESGYPYIRLENEAFEMALLECSQLISPQDGVIRFLEVGCGLGTKCEIARLHGMQSSGFDINRGYVDLAGKVFFECTFAQANAFEFDYSDYDLIYYHVLFFDDAMLFDLELRILSQLPVGGVLFVSRLSETLQQALTNQGGSLSQPTLSAPCFESGRVRACKRGRPLIRLNCDRRQNIAPAEPVDPSEQRSVLQLARTVVHAKSLFHSIPQTGMAKLKARIENKARAP